MVTFEDSNENSTWKKIVQEERTRRDASLFHLAPNPVEVRVPSSACVISVPNEYLSADEVAITQKTPEELVRLLSTGELTSTTVVQAFLQRTRIAHKLVNCVTEVLADRALARASELDAYYAEQKKPVGPLHGLPISIKEHIGFEGLDLNAGIVSWIGRKSPITASVIQIFEALGAIFYVRTTEPQGLGMIECTSNIYGTTTNPYNVGLTSGGSSGGEGALLALRGSPLGIGGDLGGSIRVPAANCGIFGLRPTTGRVPLMGCGAPSMGCESIMPTLGPMSRTIRGIGLFMEALLATKPWENDPSLHPIPWRAEDQWLESKLNPKKQDGRGLRIGILWDDGVVKPLPPIARALTRMVEGFSKIPGITIVEWKPPPHQRAMEILAKLYSTDAGTALQQDLDSTGEPWIPLAHWKAKGHPKVESLDMQSLWYWTMEREIYRYTYFQAWKDAQIDFLIGPVGPSPAPQHNTSRYWGYASIWNLLDYPALAFPVTQVDVAQDVKDESYIPRNEEERWIWDRYDVEKEVGAPVGLQLVGRRLEDEKVVETMSWMVEKLQLPFEEFDTSS